MFRLADSLLYEVMMKTTMSTVDDGEAATAECAIRSVRSVRSCHRAGLRWAGQATYQKWPRAWSFGALPWEVSNFDELMRLDVK